MGREAGRPLRGLADGAVAGRRGPSGHLGRGGGPGPGQLSGRTPTGPPPPAPPPRGGGGGGPARGVGSRWPGRLAGAGAATGPDPGGPRPGLPPRAGGGATTPCPARSPAPGTCPPPPPPAGEGWGGGNRRDCSNTRSSTPRHKLTRPPSGHPLPHRPRAYIPPPPPTPIPVTTPSRFSRVQPSLNASGSVRTRRRATMTDASRDPAVRFDAVRLDRGGRTILSGIDLVVPRGSVTAILGPSGCGKSTLLSALTGELAPAAGRVEVFGRAVPQRTRELLEMRKSIGVLLQGNGLLTDL